MVRARFDTVVPVERSALCLSKRYAVRILITLTHNFALSGRK
jgi:hypothetical protein